MMMELLRRLLALIVLIGCAYNLYFYGVSDVRSEAVEDGQGLRVNSSNQVLSLSSHALTIHARTLSYADPDLSEAIAISALTKNPSSGRAMTHLMSLYEAQGKSLQADKTADLAGKLWPANVYTRSNLADYWSRRNRPSKLIQEWNVLLIRDKSFRERLFPSLMRIVERDELSALILPYAQNPPVWWNSFFEYLSEELAFNHLERLYQLRVASERTVSLNERTSYVRRLIKERRWEEAHDTWFIGLNPNQMRYSGLVYDGGFESDVFNQGFGWQHSRMRNPKIKTDVTYGIKGRKALHVIIRKQDPIEFRHVWQQLMLPKGVYELVLRYRMDSLKTTKGLSWRIRCREGGNQILGQSLPLLGSKPWGTLKVKFSVPESCSVQRLRLEATSSFRHDHYFQGSLWFDDVRINELKIQEATN